MSVYLGIDWSENKHDVVFMNEAGASVAQLTIDHTPEGFDELDRLRGEGIGVRGGKDLQRQSQCSASWITAMGSPGAEWRAPE